MTASTRVAQSNGPGEQPLASNAANLPTKEAQQALVAGMPVFGMKQRFRRYVNKPTVQLQHLMTWTPEVAARAAAVEQEIAKNIADSDWPAETPLGKIRLIHTDLENGVENEVEFDLTELAAVGAEALVRGINTASVGGAQEASDVPTDPGLSPEAWVNGVDHRIRKPINATYPVNDRVLGREGWLGGYCSGTLVGRRLVLTAAHCVVNPDYSQTQQTYYNRADATGSTFTYPYGTVETSSYWWGGQFVSSCLNDTYYQNNLDACDSGDWALLRLPDNAWDSSPNGTPSWMGYWIPGSQINTSNVLHLSGYPGSSIDQPSNFVYGSVYGDPNAFAGNAINFRAPSTVSSESGFPLVYDISQDSSGGESGAAVWSDYPGSGGPYEVGIAVAEHCRKCTSAENPYYTADQKSHPAVVRSMSPFLSSFISSQRTNYP